MIKIVKATVKPKKKSSVKGIRKKAQQRRVRSVLKDRVNIARFEVATAIYHMKHHEVQLARFEKSPNLPTLLEQLRDAKDTYERLFRRTALGGKRPQK